MFSPIFKDKSKLLPTYVPQKLPHREHQLRLMHAFFDDVFIDVDNQPLRKIQLIGGVGTGKTCSSLRFLKEIKRKAEKLNVNLKTVYLNLRFFRECSRVVIYRNLLKKVAPEIYSSSLSASEILSNLFRYLKNKKTYLLLVFDEVDYFVEKGGQEALYEITRFNEFEPELGNVFIGMVFIARKENYMQKLDSATVSSLGRNKISFPKYDFNQLVDILKERRKESFIPGVLPDDLIGYIADLTLAYPVNGDVRYALDLLLSAGILAESEGSSKIEMKHISLAYERSHYPLTSEEIFSLSIHEKLVLLSLVKALMRDKTPYVTLSRFKLAYKLTCEEAKVKQKEDFERELQSLCDRGFVEIKSLTKIGLKGIEASKLYNLLKEVTEVEEKNAG